MPISRWNVDLPTAVELRALPKGIVLHWTGGGPRANAVDLAAYHYVIEVDGTVVAGKWPVGANMRKLVDAKYAKHTGGFNSFRVGLSCAGMKDYRSPSSTGSFPLTEVQVERMLEVAAYFIELAKLDPLDPARLCTHQEVWTRHRVKGTQNHTKTDLEFLPFRTDLKPKEVGDHLRRRVAEILAFEDSGDATVVLPDPPVLLDHHELTPTISVPESPLDVRANTPVEPRSENRALWDRFMRFFG
jgi:hypothetical protein